MANDGKGKGIQNGAPEEYVLTEEEKLRIRDEVARLSLWFRQGGESLFHHKERLKALVEHGEIMVRKLEQSCDLLESFRRSLRGLYEVDLPPSSSSIAPNLGGSVPNQGDVEEDPEEDPEEEPEEDPVEDPEEDPEEEPDEYLGGGVGNNPEIEVHDEVMAEDPEGEFGENEEEFSEAGGEDEGDEDEIVMWEEEPLAPVIIEISSDEEEDEEMEEFGGAMEEDEPEVVDPEVVDSDSASEDGDSDSDDSDSGDDPDFDVEGYNEGADFQDEVLL